MEMAQRKDFFFIRKLITSGLRISIQVVRMLHFSKIKIIYNFFVIFIYINILLGGSNDKPK